MCSTKPWQKAEWQKKRKEIIANHPYCTQCGSNENLVVHHPFQSPPHKLLFRIIALDLFEYETGGLTRDGCPKCESINIRARKTIIPKYRCNRCYNQFEDPTKVKDSFTVKRKEFWDWVENHQEQLNQVVKKQRERNYQHYLSLEGTKVLCSKCHFLFEKKGNILCKECKKNYHSGQYQTCYECYKKSLQICPLCGEQNRKPQYPLCYKCDQELFPYKWEELEGDESARIIAARRLIKEMEEEFL